MSIEQDRFHADIAQARQVETLSRRGLLSLGLATGALAVDLFVTERIKEARNHVAIEELSSKEIQRQFPNKAWIVLPGFKMGWEDSRGIATKLQDTMELRARTTYVGYSNKGFSVDEVKKTIQTYAEKEKIRKLYLYGHSFGGMVAVEVAEHFRVHPDIDVELIVLDSSPSCRDDVKDLAQLDMLATSYDMSLAIPTVARAGVEFGERVIHKNERTWEQVSNQAIEQLLPGAPSSELIQAQANYIRRFSADSHVLPAATKVAMLANLADETVNISKATQNWRNACRDSDYDVFWTNGTQPAHASPFWNKDIYCRELQRIEEIYLPLNTPERKYFF